MENDSYELSQRSKVQLGSPGSGTLRYIEGGGSRLFLCRRYYLLPHKGDAESPGGDRDLGIRPDEYSRPKVQLLLRTRRLLILLGN